jgi:dihydropteroate synthase
MDGLLQCGRYQLRPAHGAACVMGILNVTPDSFSDGGAFIGLEAALEHAESMIAQGVEIIDIGGESSRPGAESLSVEQELQRVLPVLLGVKDCGKPISVDTCKPEVMRQALAMGADMINDINGFRASGAVEAVAASDCGLCVMHMQNQPQTMQQQPEYQDVVQEVIAFLQERVACLLAAGVARERICVDPGFGFGKTLAHNLALLQQLPEIRAAVGVPVLAGLSRKSMLGTLTGRPVGERQAASLAAALAAMAQGAQLLRVHDVAQTVDAIKVWHATMKGK